MAFTLPDKGEGGNDRQSILFQEYIDVLIAGIAGTDVVHSGCAVTAQGSPDMTVAVAAGTVMSNGVPFAVAAGNVTITAADGTNPRIDLVVVNSSGTKAARTGTAAANPKPPARTANDVVLASIDVPASDTTIGATQIDDKRVMRAIGPRHVVLTGSAHSVTGVTGTSVTGLKVPLEPGTFTFRYSLICQSDTSTTGIGLGINFTGTHTKLVFIRYDVSTITTASNGLTEEESGAALVTGGVMNAWASKAESTTAPTTMSEGVGATTVNLLITLEGVIIVTADGDLELWHSSQIAATTTRVEVGSSLIYNRTL